MHPQKFMEVSIIVETEWTILQLCKTNNKVRGNKGKMRGGSWGWWGMQPQYLNLNGLNPEAEATRGFSKGFSSISQFKDFKLLPKNTSEIHPP